MKILKDIKGVFVPPKKEYRFGLIKKYFIVPRNFNKTIISIKKSKLSIGTPIVIRKFDLGWKDKFNSPRFEFNPRFEIYFFMFYFSITFVSPDTFEDIYWEMILWYLYYSDKNIIKAKKTWEWEDYDTKKSTWNDKYLINGDPIQYERKQKLKRVLK